MKALIFQVPYPAPGEALRCIEWMRAALLAVKPGEADLLLMQENANCTGTVDRAEMLSLVRGAGGVPGVIACEFDPKARFMRPASFGEPDKVGDYREVIQNACRPELYA